MPLNGDFPAAICAAIVGFAKTPICVLCWGKTRLPLGSWSRSWRGASGQRNWILVMATIATCNCQLPVERQNSLSWPLSFSMRVSRRLGQAFLLVLALSLVTITQ